MDVIVFLIVLEILGLLSFPLSRIIAGNLCDRGYSLARPIGIVIVSLTAWICSLLGLVPFILSAGIGLILLAALAVCAAYHYRDLKPDRDLLLQEGIFILTFLLAALFLMQKPGIYFAYSEDFLDSAILQSILRPGPVPFGDPWFAGLSLTYYYFGQLASAVLIALSGVKAAVGYNLAVAAVFAMGVQTAFGTGLDLTGKRLYGFFAVVLIMIAGFLAGFVQLLSYLGRTDLLGFTAFPGSPAAWLASFNFSAAGWTIPGTIVLYPFFTFLQGDLHAHFVAIPFLLALVGLCLSLSRNFSRWTFSAAVAVTIFLAGVNAWVLPGAFLLLAWSVRDQVKDRGFLVIIALGACIIAAAVLAGAAGIVLPGQGTSVLAFLLIFGVFVFISLAYLIDSHEFSRKDIFLFGAVIAVAITAVALQFLLAILVLLAFPFISRAWKSEDYPCALTGIALILIMLTEVFFVREGTPPPFERMNTVMKFYIAAWIFWGAASAYFLSRMRNRVLVAAAAVLIALACIHPALSLLSMPGAGYLGTTGSLTLDGSAWLGEQKPDDYAALEWLGSSAQDGDVVLEAPGEAYTYSSRVSPFTGLPTVLGWRSHVRSWGAKGQIDKRSTDIDRMYEGCSPELLSAYHVRYIFVGETERARYGSGLADLAGCEGLELAFRSGNTSVYAVT